MLYGYLQDKPLNFVKKIYNEFNMPFDKQSIESDLYEDIYAKRIFPICKVKYPLKDKNHLKALIKKAIEFDITNLNFIDVSNIKDMSFMFSKSIFNGDISQWDVSNVRDMMYIFGGGSIQS